jgi:Anti-sigma-K factor rskA
MLKCVMLKCVIAMSEDFLNTSRSDELDARIDATLADASTWAQPPADLRSRVLAAAQSASALASASAVAAPAAAASTTGASTTGASTTALSAADTLTADTSTTTASTTEAVPAFANAANAIPTAQRIAKPTPQTADRSLASDAGGVFETQPQRKKSSWRWIAPIAIAASFVAGLFVTRLRSTQLPINARTTMVAARSYPNASGTINMRETNSGWEFRLNTKGLPRLDKPFFYEAWIEGEKGLVPIGTFHNGVDVVLWGGVELDEYPKVVITKEREDGDPGASSERVLQGAVIFEQKK